MGDSDVDDEDVDDFFERLLLRLVSVLELLVDDDDDDLDAPALLLLLLSRNNLRKAEAILYFHDIPFYTREMMCSKNIFIFIYKYITITII